MAKATLFTWGPILFQVYPLNVNEWHHDTSTDWSKKEIAGAPIYREWVGENDETIVLRGKVFPKFYASYGRRDRPGASVNEPFNLPGSGLGHLEVLNAMRQLGQAHVLLRGDGWHFGWYVIERMSRGHTYIDVSGVGQQIEFEATFQRVPVPEDPSYFSKIWGNTP